MTVKRATLHVEITAPARSVVISGWRDQTRTPITSASSPVGKRLTAPIRDAQLLQLDAQGGLLLNIDVGTHPHESDASLAKVGWKIDKVWLEIDEAVVD